MQHCNRSNPEARTLLNTCGLIVAHAAIIRCFIFFGVVERCYVRWTSWPRNWPTASYLSIWEDFIECSCYSPI